MFKITAEEKKFILRRRQAKGSSKKKKLLKIIKDLAENDLAFELPDNLNKLSERELKEIIDDYEEYSEFEGRDYDFI
jgi:hypothetical protein